MDLIDPDIQRTSLKERHNLTDDEWRCLLLLGGDTDEEDLPHMLGKPYAATRTILSRLLDKTGAPTVHLLRNLGKIARRSKNEPYLPRYARCELPVGCGDAKPLLYFPQWPLRMLCVDCLARYENRERTHKDWERAREAFSKIIASTKAVKVAVPRIQELLGELYDEFGGPKGFVQTLTKQLKVAMELKPGSKTVIDSLMAVLKMNIAVNQFDAAQDETRMSDEELRNAMWSLMQERINEGLVDSARAAAYESLMNRDMPAAETVVEATASADNR